MNRILLPLALLTNCAEPTVLPPQEARVEAERAFFAPSILEALNANNGTYLDPSTNCLLTDQGTTIQVNCPKISQ